MPQYVSFSKLVTSHDLELEQMDIKTAFLHGDLDEELYLQELEGFEVKAKEDHVLELKDLVLFRPC